MIDSNANLIDARLPSVTYSAFKPAIPVAVSNNPFVQLFECDSD